MVVPRWVGWCVRGPSAIENGPVEIVDWSMKKWWFSIVFCMFARGYTHQDYFVWIITIHERGRSFSTNQYQYIEMTQGSEHGSLGCHPEVCLLPNWWVAVCSIRQSWKTMRNKSWLPCQKTSKHHLSSGFLDVQIAHSFEMTPRQESHQKGSEQQLGWYTQLQIYIS